MKLRGAAERSTAPPTAYHLPFYQRSAVCSHAVLLPQPLGLLRKVPGRCPRLPVRHPDVTLPRARRARLQRTGLAGRVTN